MMNLLHVNNAIIKTTYIMYVCMNVEEDETDNHG